MLKLNRYQKIIIKDLFRADGSLNAYTFYKRYKFDVFFLIKTSQKLIRLGLVEFDGTSLKLTIEGKRKIFEEQLVSKDDTKKPWLILLDKKFFRI